MIPRYCLFFKDRLKKHRIPVVAQNQPFHCLSFLTQKQHNKQPKKDQAFAVQAIIKTAQGRAWRPLMMIAPRGRGKTTALGFAINTILKEKKSHQIILTAPRQSALFSCFKIITEQRVSFLAPDKLTQNAPKADLLIVDEAAGIPLFLLKQWLQTYPRIIFSSTIDGYEGGAGGFYLRFKALLQDRYPAFREITLNEPMRWANQDPLESWVKQSLLLEVKPAEIQSINVKQCQIQQIDRAELIQQPLQLEALFALFRVGHYRTTPNHLRQLLDAPDIQIYIMAYQQHWIGAAICVDEGGLEAELCEQISQGKRRVKGHLSAQNRVYYQLDLTAGQKQYRRIQRIAVIDSLQNQGLASQLIEWIATQAKQDQKDYLACSFGGRAKLFYFWKKNQFKPIHLSTQIETSSNTQSILMLRALNIGNKMDLTLSMHTFQTHFIQQVRDFKFLDARLIALLIQTESTFNIDASILKEVSLFTQYQRSFDASKQALKQYLIALLKSINKNAPEKLEQKMAIQLLLQNKPIEMLCLEYNYTGQKALIHALKAFFRKRKEN